MSTWNVTSTVHSLYNTNITTFNGDDHDSLDAMGVLAIIFMSSIAVFGFQGNLWVAVVILNNTSLRTSMTNIFVLNLIIIDLLASALAMPLAVVAFSFKDTSQDIMVCEASGFISTCLMLNSILTLCIISTDRFYSIAMPLRHAAHATPLMALIVVLLTWITGVSVACLPCFGVNSYSYKTSEGICSFKWAGDNSDRIFVVIVFIVCFLIPSLIILSMYFTIFCIARKAARSVAPQLSESTPSTLVSPDLEISQSDNKFHSVVHNRQISLDTIDDSFEMRPRIRIFSLSSDPSQSPAITQQQGCAQHNIAIFCSDSSEFSHERSAKYESKRNGSMDNFVTYDKLSTKHPTTHSNTHLENSQHKSHSGDNQQGNAICANCLSQKDGDGHEVMGEKSISSQSTANQPPTNDIPELSLSNETTTSVNHNTATYSHVTVPPRPGTQSTNSTARHNHVKAFRTVMIIVLSYLLLWGPYFVCQVHHLRGHVVSSDIQLLVTWLGFISYAVNPYLYGGMNRLIRDELSQLYQGMFQWLKSFGYCLCWACCRCCCCVTKNCFLQDKSVLHCMPWLKKEDVGSSQQREGGEGGRGGRGDDINDDGGGESFFEFLQRTQDEETPVPLSLVIENDQSVQ